jgi:ABC-type thiamine transport system substrate-binding protein
MTVSINRQLLTYLKCEVGSVFDKAKVKAVSSDHVTYTFDDGVLHVTSEGKIFVPAVEEVSVKKKIAKKKVTKNKVSKKK